MSAERHPLADLPPEDSGLAAELADLAGAIHPASSFVRRLNRHLDEQAANRPALTRANASLAARFSALRAHLLRLEIERPSLRRMWAGLVTLVLVVSVGAVMLSAFQAMPVEQPPLTPTPLVPVTGSQANRAQNPRAAPAATNLGFLSPPSPSQCDSWRKVIENELGVAFDLQRSAVYTERYNYTFSNTLPNNSGRGCQLSAQGSAATFSGILSLSRRLEDLVTRRGYTHYGDFRFESGVNNEGFEPDEYGKVAYFTYENRRIAVAVTGRPLEGAACPTGQPRENCSFPPEQMAINVRVTLANDEVTPRINSLINAFIYGMREANSDTGLLLASELRASLVGADALNRLMGVYDRTRFENFSYDIISYYQRQVTVALYLDEHQRAPDQAGPSNYLIMHQEEGTWRISAISSASDQQSPRHVVSGLLSAPDAQTCAGLGERLQAAYPQSPITGYTAAFTDPSSSAPTVNGEGCSLVLEGGGSQFGSIQAVLDRVRPLLTQMGFAYQSMFDATGGYPNPVISGDWYGKIILLRQPVSPLAETTARALIAVSWRPKDAGSCLAGQPIAACSLKPENQHYTVRVSLANDRVTATINRSMDQFMRLWTSGSKFVTVWMTTAMQQQVEAEGGSDDLIHGVYPERVDNFSFNIQAFDGNRATLRLWVSHRVSGEKAGAAMAVRSVDLQRLGERWLVDRVTPVMVSEAERLFSEGKVTQAVNAYQAVVEAYPPNMDTLLAMGETLIYARRYQQALETAGVALELHPDDPRALALKGWALGWLDDLEQARALLEQAVGLDRGDAKSRAYLAMILARQYDLNHDDTLLARAFDQASTAYQNAPESIEVNRARSQVALRQGNYTEAVRFIEQAIALNENLSRLHVELAEIFTAVPVIPQAISELQRAAALDPNDWQALFQLSRLYVDEGLFPRALEFAAEAVSAAPENNRLLAHLGEMQYRSRRYGEAALTLRLALFGGEGINGQPVAPLRGDSAPPSRYDFLFGMSLAREGKCVEATQVAAGMRTAAPVNDFSSNAAAQIEQACAT